jgi:TusA-related sulfurtransferase
LTSDSNTISTIDCVGLYCPEPVFRTRLELDKLAIGEILEVFADDPAAEEDIKSLVKRIGHELLEITKEGSVFRFLIRKTK